MKCHVNTGSLGEWFVSQLPEETLVDKSPYAAKKSIFVEKMEALGVPAHILGDVWEFPYTLKAGVTIDVYPNFANQVWVQILCPECGQVDMIPVDTWTAQDFGDLVLSSRESLLARWEHDCVERDPAEDFFSGEETADE